MAGQRTGKEKFEKWTYVEGAIVAQKTIYKTYKKAECTVRSLGVVDG
jgi:hypothetical protein